MVAPMRKVAPMIEASILKPMKRAGIHVKRVTTRPAIQICMTENGIGVVRMLKGGLMIEVRTLKLMRKAGTDVSNKAHFAKCMVSMTLSNHIKPIEREKL